MKFKRLGAIAITVFVLSLCVAAGPAQTVQPPAVAAAMPMAKDPGYAVDGLTHVKWKANRGKLGNPVSKKSCVRGGCSQRFQKGFILWTKKTGTQIVLKDAIGSRYSASGWTKGNLGWPAKGASGLAVRGGKVQKFQKGLIYWSPKTGAHAVSGGIKRHYAANRYERGFLGYPKTEEVSVKNGARQGFEGGNVYWTRSGGKTFSTTKGGIQKYYEKKGGPNSSLGLPTSNKASWRGGAYQRFQGGVIIWGAKGGAKNIDAGHFKTLTGNFGKYGWPTKDTWKNSAGTHTRFQKGIITTGAPAPKPSVKPEKPVHPITDVMATAQTAVLYGDSQLYGDSWSEQAARAMGFSDQPSGLAFGGLGYSTATARAGGTGLTAVELGLVSFPKGNPGLVLVTLGGNDAKSNKSDARVIADSTALWAKLKLMYPNSKIVINGVLSRDDASHIQRHHVDGVLAANAKKQGVTYISLTGLATNANAEYKDDTHLTQDGLDAAAKLYTPLLKAALGR